MITSNVTTEKSFRVVVLVNGNEESVSLFSSFESAVNEFQEKTEEKFDWVPQVSHTNIMELQESEGGIDVMLQFI